MKKLLSYFVLIGLLVLMAGCFVGGPRGNTGRTMIMATTVISKATTTTIRTIRTTTTTTSKTNAA